MLEKYEGSLEAVTCFYVILFYLTDMLRGVFPLLFVWVTD
jgi:hypothetical protein